MAVDFEPTTRKGLEEVFRSVGLPMEGVSREAMQNMLGIVLRQALEATQFYLAYGDEGLKDVKFYELAMKIEEEIENFLG